MTIYPLIEILSHEFYFQPFSYKMQIEGRLEINSQYRLGAKILIGKLIFPNQTVDLIDIVPDLKDKCFSSSSKKCNVFRFNTFIQLSGDKYFSREFKNQEKIPFLFLLDFNSSNLESFKESNYIFQKSKYKYGKLSDYISNLKLIKINENLNYKNSFYLDDLKKHHSINIPVSWTIKNGKQINSFENIEIKFKNLEKEKHKNNQHLFDIKTTGNVAINEHKIVFNDGKEVQLKNDKIERKWKNEWTSYYLDEKITKDLKSYKTEKDEKFLKNSWNIWSKLRLLLKNHGYAITLKQTFNFENKKIGLFRIIPKYDQYFYDRKKYKYIAI